MLRFLSNRSFTAHQELVLILAMLKTLDISNKEQKKEQIRLTALAEAYFEALPDIELQLVIATTEKLLQAGFPNISHDALISHLADVKINI